ncbi:hypothetical protein HQ487_03905 [Candidatus Uhrbacteria bacterium]|nr:hypothetical protein [Candidatus Uhrbacteria bacterium]
MKLQLPEPHVFGQGDALACLVIWSMGVLGLLIFGLDWYEKGSPDWFIGLLSMISIVVPFGLMLYKAFITLEYEDTRRN